MDFFKSGLTRALLKAAGKVPELRDSFTIAVTVGARLPRDLRNHVGRGSRQHDFAEEALKILDTSRSVTCVNVDKAGVFAGDDDVSWSSIVISFSHRSSILLVKKAQKRSARSLPES